MHMTYNVRKAVVKVLVRKFLHESNTCPSKTYYIGKSAVVEYTLIHKCLRNKVSGSDGAL